MLLFTPLVFWTSLQNYYDSTKSYFIMGVAEFLMLCFVWFLFSHPGFRINFNQVGKSLTFFVAVLLVASIFGIDPSFSFWASIDRITGGLMWLHLLAIFFIVSSVLRTERDWRDFFLVSISVALLVALFHLLHLVGIDLLPETKSGSTIGNSSFFGAYLLFQFFFSLLLVARSEKWVRTFGYISVVILVLTLFYSTAQAAIFAFVGGCVLLVALFLIISGKKGAYRSLGLTVLVSLFIVFMGGAFFLFQPTSWLHQQFVEHSGEARFVVWDMAWEGIKERPLLGWGLENFQYVSLRHHNPCLGSQQCGLEYWFDRAHNKILDLLIESGIVGLLAYIAVFFFAVVGVWHQYRATLLSFMTPVIVTSAFAVYFIQNLFGFDISTTLLFWIFLLAYVSSVQQKGFLNPGNESRSNIPRNLSVIVPALTTVLLLFIFFFSVVQPIRGNLAVRQSILASTMEEHLVAYERATTISEIGIDLRRWYLARQSAAVMWKTPKERMQLMESSATRELSLAETGLQDSINEAPNFLLGYLHLGLVYHTYARFFGDEKFQEAEAVLREAIFLNPSNPQPLWALAAVNLEQNKFDEALALTQAAVDLNSSVVESHVQRLIVAKFIGDQALFSRYAQEALTVSPSLKEEINLIARANLEEERPALIFELY